MNAVDVIAHGTLKAYRAGKCRCDECRAANAQYHREWRAANPERAKRSQDKYGAAHRGVLRDRTQRWRDANPGKSAEISQRWRQNNVNHARAKSLEWNRSHPETMKQVAARYRAKNAAQIAEAVARWRRENPERVKTNATAWRANNRSTVYAGNARRRALLRSVESLQVSGRDWERLCARHGNRCAYCGEAKKLTMDHVIPLTRSGRHSIGNILPACQKCNSSKGAKLLIEWIGRRR